MVKINIKISNRAMYSLLVVFGIVLLAVGVYAYGGSSPSVMGHSAGEIDGVCLSDGTGCPLRSYVFSGTLPNDLSQTCDPDISIPSEINRDQIVSVDMYIQIGGNRWTSVYSTNVAKFTEAAPLSWVRESLSSNILCPKLNETNSAIPGELYRGVILYYD